MLVRRRPASYANMIVGEKDHLADAALDAPDRCHALKGISAILNDLAHRGDDKLTLGEVIRQGGSRSHWIGPVDIRLA